MTEAIRGEFVKLVLKAAQRYSKEFKTIEQNVQIVFKLNEESENVYAIYKEYAEHSQVKFNNLLGVTIDFSGRSLYVPPALNTILLKLNDELKLEPNKVKVMLIRRTKEEQERIGKIIDDFRIEESQRQSHCQKNKIVYEEVEEPAIDKDFRLCVYNGDVYVKDVFFNHIFSLL